MGLKMTKKTLDQMLFYNNLVMVARGHLAYPKRKATTSKAGNTVYWNCLEVNYSMNGSWDETGKIITRRIPFIAMHDLAREMQHLTVSDVVTIWMTPMFSTTQNIEGKTISTVGFNVYKFEKENVNDLWEGG